MVEYPNFDKRERYGSSGDWTAPVAARFASISEDVAAEDREVFLQYKARRLRVRVTRVMYQNEYEGCVLGFEGVPPVVEMDGLQAGSMVGFHHEQIWGFAD
jgi:hypothetical protein